MLSKHLSSGWLLLKALGFYFCRGFSWHVVGCSWTTLEVAIWISNSLFSLMEEFVWICHPRAQALDCSSVMDGWMGFLQLCALSRGCSQVRVPALWECVRTYVLVILAPDPSRSPQEAGTPGSQSSRCLLCSVGQKLLLPTSRPPFFSLFVFIPSYFSYFLACSSVHQCI